MGIWQKLKDFAGLLAVDPYKAAAEWHSNPWAAAPSSPPVTLARALSEIASAAKLDRAPAPVITTDISSAMILARLLDRDMPGLQHATNISPQQDPMCVIMFDGVKIKWSSKRET